MSFLLHDTQFSHPFKCSVCGEGPRTIEVWYNGVVIPYCDQHAQEFLGKTEHFKHILEIRRIIDGKKALDYV